MTTISQQSQIKYPHKTIRRAEMALKCAPFRLKLFQEMRSRSVPLSQIANQTGVEKQHIVKPLSELKVENELVWLIQVGLLRREVDGQGITDSFRLTPLGRQLVAKWEAEKQEIPAPSWLTRIQCAIIRWFRLPF
ncbi:hypothetical protein FRE64_06215 [Euhalothece natronophila Z-M001]|uniref:Winged helix-turn-helix transcriptional regulator n=1 Tax=Euhalothece natronophila Z-M001 TaxID=522448 RepID=A0A5B8NKR8_9CHRO|nr:Npun_F0494 family protein [Euhalothece natronophila]QDZ39558.1 hypothetical protein FRE64_06215 [Euhalothece natronophila Z-M001]